MLILTTLLVIIGIINLVLYALEIGINISIKK